MENDKVLHRRFVTNTEPLFEEILKLGFEEGEPVGRGLNQFRIFYKDLKEIRVSHEKLELVFKPKLGAPVVNYSGLTVHDEMLKFWATRDPIKIKEDE
jgi:hypothetical protein